MLAEIGLGIKGIQVATGLVKVLSGASTEAQINEVKIGLQNGLLDAQGALFAAQAAQTADAARIHELEQEIVDLKDWKSEKQRYQLQAIDTGAFAFVPKPGMENGEPPHWLCTKCFSEGQRGFLQRGGEAKRLAGNGIQAEWKCNICTRPVSVYFHYSPSDPRPPGEPPHDDPPVVA